MKKATKYVFITLGWQIFFVLRPTHPGTTRFPNPWEVFAGLELSRAGSTETCTAAGATS